MSQIDVGSHVKIFGRATGSSSVIATKVLEKPGGGTVVLKGPVESKDQPSRLLRVLGVEINTSSIPQVRSSGKMAGQCRQTNFSPVCRREIPSTPEARWPVRLWL